MDAKLEKQFSDLIDEVQEHGPGALYAALQVLRNSYLAGRHNEFAKYCCDFQQIEGVTLTASGLGTTKGPKPPRETLH